jgi:hypothetical protein
MRKLITILTLLVVFLVTFSVQAQDVMQFSLLKVEIYPEYDQPGVLLIYHMTLATGTNLPANLELHIPSNAQVNAVAFMDPGNQKLFDTPYDRSVQGQWSEIKLTTPTLQVQLEYYLPLVKDGTIRHIIFDWAGDYIARQLEINFHTPIGAENVNFSLAPTDTNLGQDGLTNYQLQKSDLGSGETFTLKIDYQRQTDTLNISSKAPQAVTTLGPDTPGRVSMNDIMPWILAGIGVLLLIAGIFSIFTWQRGSQGSGKSKRYGKPHNKGEEASTYCHQCGHRAQPSDVFCRTCGARLKRGSMK